MASLNYVVVCIIKILLNILVIKGFTNRHILSGASVNVMRFFFKMCESSQQCYYFECNCIYNKILYKKKSFINIIPTIFIVRLIGLFSNIKQTIFIYTTNSEVQEPLITIQSALLGLCATNAALCVSLHFAMRRSLFYILCVFSYPKFIYQKRYSFTFKQCTLYCYQNNFRISTSVVLGCL